MVGQHLPVGPCWFMTTGYPESELMRYLNKTIGAAGALALAAAGLLSGPALADSPTTIRPARTPTTAVPSARSPRWGQR